MEILPGLPSLPDPRVRSPIVTWGVFDGVHRGHRKVLDSVVSWAREEGVSSMVLTFDRHPAEVLTGRPVPLLSPLAGRLGLIGERGIEFCAVLNFTVEFARTTAEEFVREIVRGLLGARGVVLGHDSRFGRDRAGDIGFLAEISRALGIEVRQCEPDRFRGRPVSSSLIREAIAAGRLEDARTLLGRAPSVAGTVARGDRRGTSLGFPTANLEIGGSVRPPAGVYAAEVAVDGRDYRAVVNIGTRPTFHENGVETIEAHLLDFSGGDLYGRVLELRFLWRVRDEMRFPGPAALKKQISDDIALVRGR